MRLEIDIPDILVRRSEEDKNECFFYLMKERVMEDLSGRYPDLSDDLTNKVATYFVKNSLWRSELPYWDQLDQVIETLKENPEKLYSPEILDIYTSKKFIQSRLQEIFKENGNHSVTLDFVDYPNMDVISHYQIIPDQDKENTYSVQEGSITISNMEDLESVAMYIKSHNKDYEDFLNESERE